MEKVLYFEILRERGKKKAELKEWGEAVEIYRQMLSILTITKENRSIAHGNLSLALYQLKDYTHSLEEGKKHLELSSKMPKAYYRVGMIYEALNNLLAALQIYMVGLEKVEGESNEYKSLLKEKYDKALSRLKETSSWSLLGGPPPDFKAVKLQDVVDIYLRELHDVWLERCDVIPLKLESITKENGREVWITTKADIKDFTPEKFYPHDETTSKNCFWKIRCADGCKYMNLGLIRAVEGIIRRGYVVYHGKNEEKRFPVIGIEIKKALYSKYYSNPKITGDGEADKLIRGTLNLSAGETGCIHYFACFVTSKCVGTTSANRTYYIDLSGPQFDIFCYQKEGYPCKIYKGDTNASKIEEDFLFLPKFISDSKLLNSFKKSMSEVYKLWKKTIKQTIEKVA